MCFCCLTGYPPLGLGHPAFGLGHHHGHQILGNYIVFSTKIPQWSLFTTNLRQDWLMHQAKYG